MNNPSERQRLTEARKYKTETKRLFAQRLIRQAQKSGYLGVE